MTCGISIAGLTALSTKMRASRLPRAISHDSIMPKVNVPGVKVYVSKGITYAYDRKTGTRLTPPHIIGTPEWFRALDAARAKLKPDPKEQPGTWGAIVTEYRKSPRFLDLAPRTKEDYL